MFKVKVCVAGRFRHVLQDENDISDDASYGAANRKFKQHFSPAALYPPPNASSNA